MNDKYVSYHAALPIFLALSLALAGCGPSQDEKIAAVQQNVDALAASLNDDFTALRELGEKYADILGQMLDSGERYPDMPEGEYVWFQDDFYSTDPARKRDHTLAMLNGFYLPEGSGGPIPENYDSGRKIAPDGPEMERIRAHMAIFEAVWPKAQADFDARFAPGTWYFFSVFPQDWLMMYSFHDDIVSALPLGLNLRMLSQAFWMQGILPESNPDRHPYWKPHVWIGQSGEGLLMGVSTPYRARRDVDYAGVESTFFLGPYMEEKLRGIEGNIVVLDAASTVVDSTGADLFKKLPDFDYLEQLKQNPVYGDEFRLTHAGQSAEIQALGKAVLEGRNRFEQSINGTEYLVVVSPVPEVNFYVVGLIER